MKPRIFAIFAAREIKVPGGVLSTTEMIGHVEADNAFKAIDVAEKIWPKHFISEAEQVVVRRLGAKKRKGK